MIFAFEERESSLECISSHSNQNVQNTIPKADLLTPHESREKYFLFMKLGAEKVENNGKSTYY